MKFPRLFGRSKTETEHDHVLAALRELEAGERSAEKPMHPKFSTLVAYLNGIPGVRVLGQGDSDGIWWIKLRIDVYQPHAWNIVQELGWVLNELSISERLPTVFKPVSAPPYLNGGPADYLSWVIECHDIDCAPGSIMKCLEDRLPKPSNELTQWEELDK